MTCSNAQFSVLHRLVANAFEHAACRCDVPLGHPAPNTGPSHHTLSAKCPLDLSFLALHLEIPALFVYGELSFPC